jgi:hypothetical protein
MHGARSLDRDAPLDDVLVTLCWLAYMQDRATGEGSTSDRAFPFALPLDSINSRFTLHGLDAAFDTLRTIHLP